MTTGDPLSKEPQVMRWWWVRHAPIEGFRGEINGQLDAPADCTNDAAFKALARLLPQAPTMATPLIRTQQTLAAVRRAGLDLPEPVLEPRFMEQHFGDWQGLTWDGMRDLDAGVHDRFWEDPCVNAPPGGESFAQQMARVAEGINGLLKDAVEDRVVFAHGGTIRAAVAHAFALTPEQAMGISIDNLSITRLDYLPGGTLKGKGGGWRIIHVNRPPHLD